MFKKKFILKTWLTKSVLSLAFHTWPLRDDCIYSIQLRWSAWQPNPLTMTGWQLLRGCISIYYQNIYNKNICMPDIAYTIRLFTWWNCFIYLLHFLNIWLWMYITRSCHVRIPIENIYSQFTDVHTYVHSFKIYYTPFINRIPNIVYIYLQFYAALIHIDT